LTPVVRRDKGSAAYLSPEERADPTWTTNDNDDWWVDFFTTRRNEELHNIDGLIEVAASRSTSRLPMVVPLSLSPSQR
jgi:hypothetical protein